MNEIGNSMWVGEMIIATPCRCNTCGFQADLEFTQVVFSMDRVFYFTLPQNVKCHECKSSDIIFLDFQT